MAKEIVAGLFGADPALLGQQQMTTNINRAYQFANLSPAEQSQYSAYLGGVMGGQALGGLLGVEDPVMAKASLASRLASQYDITSEQGLREYAAALAQNGAPDLAQMAIKRADEIRTTGLTQEKLKAQTIAAGREKLPAIGQLQIYREQLIDQFGKDDPRVKEVDAAIKAKGEGTAPKVAIDLGGLTALFAKKEAEAGGKNVADQIAKAQDALAGNSKVSRDIAEVERILPNAFTGQFANFSKTASKTLSGLGIPVSEKASNTETLNALFTNFVLPAVRQLPGSLAAKELDFLRQSKPEALQEPATIKRLVGLLKDDIAANRALVKRADEYRKADKFGSLQDFNIALQQDNIYQDLTRYRQLEARVRSGQKITKEEADFAKKIEKDLGL